MNTKNWKQRFTDEFGIHFSASELQFALSFIEEEIEEAYKRGQLAEIEANATADITIAMEKVEQIREEAYDRGAMEATTVANEVIQKAREEAKREAYAKGKAYRDAIEGSIPQSMIDQHVILAEAKGYTKGLADGTGKPLLAIEQIRKERDAYWIEQNKIDCEEAKREERTNLVEWMTNVKGVYSAHDVRMSFISYINALNSREDSASNQ
jgi:hypothetical protein